MLSRLWQPLHATGVGRSIEIVLLEAALRTRAEEATAEFPIENWGRHEALLAHKRRYFFEEQRDGHYRRHPNDPPLVCFYLPQYHPIPENDDAWGPGFTEWTNVAAARPRFMGHEQPLLPRDLGFYDLRLDSVLQTQVELARRGGIRAFCFYYYWFGGRRLLSLPLDTFLRHREWDLQFAVCWANENWTRRWDGQDNDVIVRQPNNPEDAVRFAEDIAPLLLDPRYMRYDEKPVLLVYRHTQLPDATHYVNVWRRFFRERYQTELYLLAVMSFDPADARLHGFDGTVEFPPLSLNYKAVPLDVGRKPPLLDPGFYGAIADYRRIALNDTPGAFKFPTLNGVMPRWDNDPRRHGRGSMCFHLSSPDLYGVWLDRMLAYETRQASPRPVFINAWNEWAEGTTLEPTQMYGHAYLNRTVEVLSQHSADQGNRERNPLYGLRVAAAARIAVVIHVYYPEAAPAIARRLKMLPRDRSVFITLDEAAERQWPAIRRLFPDAEILIVPNRGRDMLPFLHVARRIRHLQFAAVLKLHTKRSVRLGSGRGEEWFRRSITSLLPSPARVDAVSALLHRQRALVGPEGMYVSLREHIGSNEERCRDLVSLLSADGATRRWLTSPSAGFFGGSMFWISSELLDPLLNLHLMPEDFEAEAGQVDGTLPHALERIVGLLPEVGDGRTYTVGAGGLHHVSAPLTGSFAFAS